MPQKAAKQTLRSSYRYAQRVTRQASSTFYLASRLFSRQVRCDLWAVYAFCRIADDLADAPGMDTKLRQEELGLLRHALTTRRYIDGDLLWPALFDVIKRHKIDIKYFIELLDGVEGDLHPANIKTMAELEHYSYLVAGTVGIICAHILGRPSKSTCKAAEQLGVAMQITNILRDVSIDATIGRLYIPADLRAKYGLSEQTVVAGDYDERTIAVMSVLARRANELYGQAAEGISLLEKPNQRPVRIALKLYQSILARIEQKRFRVYNTRVRLNAFEKLLLVVRTK